MYLCLPGLAFADPEDIRHLATAGEPEIPAAPSTAAPPPGALLMPTPPATLHVPERGGRRWGVFGAGAALFAVGYALDAGMTYGTGHRPSSTSLIPLAGPLLQLKDSYSIVSLPPSTGSPQLDAQADAAANRVNHAVQIAVTVGLVVDFALQLTGLAMAVAGPLCHRGVERRRVALGATGSLRVTF